MIIGEPAYVDRSNYLYFGDKARLSYTLTLGQQGSASVPIYVAAADSYAPTVGWQVYLYDQNASGATLVFAGKIDRSEIRWMGNNGDRIYTMSLVSFEQCFATIRAKPQSFFVESAAAIFTSLFGSECSGVPVTLGTVNAPFILNEFQVDWDAVADLFKKLAVSGATTGTGANWGIDLTDLSLYLKPPSTTPAPYAPTDINIAFESHIWETNEQDYRNRQIVQGSLDAFASSSELFAFSGSFPQSFALMRPAQVVNGAWLTNNTQNSQTGTFSGNPSNGDTISISYPQTGSIYNWAANAPYSIGQVIIDPLNHVQKCTVAGLSGSTQPSWNHSGGTTSDGPGSPNPGGLGGVIWTDLGVSGPGGLGAEIYTFVTALDNRQWGQVLIGANAAASCANLVLAINGDDATRGTNFSWPTWESSLLNASASSTTITVKNKAAGAGYQAALSEASSAFSWSGSTTTGGITTFGTVELQVSQNGQSNTANVYYTPGSEVVAIASTPGGTASYIQIQYQRANGDTVIVEDTAAVAARAAIEGGTGKYMCKTEDTSNTSNTSILQEAQAALAAYETIPVRWNFQVWKPGIQPGQLLDLSLVNLPTGIASLAGATTIGTAYQRPLTIDHTKIDAALTDFPVLVAGTFSWLATVANGGRVINASGIDIYFSSDAAGLVVLPFERVAYNPVTGACEFWVQVPAISSSVDTVFYCNYGATGVVVDLQDRTGTWDANFIGVWHFGDGTTLDLTDSTSNHNDGTNVGGVTATASPFSGAGGQGAANFNGSSYIQIGTPASLNLSGPITVEFTVTNPGTNVDSAFIGKGHPNLTGWDWLTRVTGDSFSRLWFANPSGAFSGTSVGIRAGSPAYIAGGYDGSNTGQADYDYSGGNTFSGATTATWGSGAIGNNASVNLNFGAFSDGSSPFTGVLDEIRISNVVRSQAWINAQARQIKINGTSIGHVITSIGAESSITITRKIPWLVQEVSGELIPLDDPYMDQAIVPGGGHLQYTITVINASQIFDYMDFWEGLGGSNSGGGSGGFIGGSNAGPIGATSGITANEIQQEAFTYAADTGSTNAYAVALSPAPTLTAGSVVVFKAANGNTGASTLAVNGGSATPIKKSGSTALASGDIASGQIIVCVYDGTNWQLIGGTGSGGGFSNPMTTKGDVIVAATGGAAARLAVGTNGQVPMANSAATNGVDWENPLTLTTTGTSGAATLTPGNPYTLNIPQYSGGGAMIQISRTVLGSPAASVTFSTISGSYSELRLVIVARSAQAVTLDSMTMQVNSDTTAAHYVGRYVSNASTGTQSGSQPGAYIGNCPGSSVVSNAPSINTVYLPGYAGTTFLKQFYSEGGGLDVGNSFASSSMENITITTAWNSTSAITQIVVNLLSGANFVTGSTFTLYGIT